MTDHHSGLSVRGLLLLLFFVLVEVGPLTTAVSAQIPETFTNLQVLPEDISRQQLIGTMRNYATSLGVRCSYCHTVSDALNQPDDDFASDAKVTKERARIMMGMVREINANHLPLLPEGAAQAVSVGCVTCHSGRARPIPIEQLVSETIDTEGVEVALDEYRRLRARYYGAAAYDFQEGPMAGLAQRLATASAFEAAQAVLSLNLEFEVATAATHFVRGQVFEQAGDTEQAISSYRTVLEIQPNHRNAANRLEALGGGVF